MKKYIHSLFLLLFFAPAVSVSGEMDPAILAEAAQVEKLLNETLELAIGKIRKNNQGYPMLEEWVAEIRASHQMWLKFRELEVGVVGHRWRSGGAGRAQTLWQIKLTKERIEHLRSDYHPS